MIVKKNSSGLFLLGAAFFLAACSAPADETWFRITGFQGSGADGATTNIASLESEIRTNETDHVDVLLENFTTLVSVTDSVGVGIFVYHATVEYRLHGFSLPTYQYAVSLYLPPPGSLGGDGAGSGVLKDFPLVPVVFKRWLLNPQHFPTQIAHSPFQVSSHITLLARTDEGRELETTGDLTILFQ